MSVASTQAQKKIDLKILVVTDTAAVPLADGKFAQHTNTKAFAAAAEEAFVPFEVVDLDKEHRIDEAFLTTENGQHARFQAVVLPSRKPDKLTEAERTALDKFEKDFKIREFDAQEVPSTAIGLQSGVGGSLDGITASVRANGVGEPFSYLRGKLRFDPGSWGVLVAPDSSQQSRFTTHVAAPADSDNVLLGVFKDSEDRERMVLTASMNEYQFQFQALFPGILNWLTYGVHVGTERHYFAVHVDDVFMSDFRWSDEHQCISGHPGCDAPVSEIVMTADDARFLVGWQNTSLINPDQFKLDLVFNGQYHRNAGEFAADLDLAPEERAKWEDRLQMGQTLIDNRESFGWINHTYTHADLNPPADEDTIAGEITDNQTFATDFLSPTTALRYAANELVTGVHSGLSNGEDIEDNKNIGAALLRGGIQWIATDNSREKVQRKIGISEALTVPRFPMNLFADVGRKDEAVLRYNSIHKPNPPVTDYDTGILEGEEIRTLQHILQNSPRPHYAHQNNLAEDRLLYEVVDRVLTRYRETFAESAGLVNATMKQFGEEMTKQQDWRAVTAPTAYITNGMVVVPAADGVRAFPLTFPTGMELEGLTPYADSNTGWHSLNATAQIPLSSSVEYPR